MAGHFNTSAFTSQAAITGAAGQFANTVVVQHAFGTLFTGSVSLSVAKLPPGARITDLIVTKTNDAFGAGADTLAVYAGEGGVAFTPENLIMTTATVGQTVRVGGLQGGVNVTAGQTLIASPNLGKRLTASGTLFAHWLLSTTQASTVNTFRFVMNYLSVETGD